MLHANAYAKINWDLRILGKRADNFHELDSIFVTVSLNDEMSFEPHHSLTLSCSDSTLPVDDTNLVMKAAKVLAERSSYRGGAKIHLVKKIPMGGGMGDGSSDAACALASLNTLWNLNWSVERLSAIAAELGSDVAYFLRGGWCLCRGRGEIVERMAAANSAPAVKILLVLPPLHVSTPAVYKALRYPPWDGFNGRNALELDAKLAAMINALHRGEACDPELRNDLSDAARQVEPKLI